MPADRADGFVESWREDVTDGLTAPHHEYPDRVLHVRRADIVGIIR